MVATEVARHRTAMGRGALSRPVMLALNDGLLRAETTFFDYGCGRGGDLERLARLGHAVSGWDPAHHPQGERQPADVVNLGYVVNVIESPSERAEALQAAWNLAKEVLVVAARPDWEGRDVPGKRYGDGILTGRGTFQKFFAQAELRGWIDSILSMRSVAAAPGIFYVFRDDVRAQSFLAARVRHRPPAQKRPRVSEVLYETHRDILDPVIAFIEGRGRAPESFEVPEVATVVERFRSVKAALAIVRRVTGDETWQTARATAIDDLIVYLALAAFGGRPKFTGLPLDVQVDVKSFFGSYKEACRAADAVLFRAGKQEAVDQACRASQIGKLTPTALYVHVSALAQMEPLLRVYEGCGRALTGTVEEATIVKLNRVEPKISYLAYPTFDDDPHPSLTTSIRADLRRLHVKFSDFRTWDSPPILHRKETFVGAEYPRRGTFARLTTQEERLGLLDHTATIGNLGAWSSLVLGKGLRFNGHRLVRSRVRDGCETPD